MESKCLVSCSGDCVKVELCGRLDATNSEGLQNELKQFAGRNIAKLVFLAKELEYISSAGLRVIIFAKQKIGVDAHLYLIAPQEAIVNVVKMSGLDNFITVQDSFPA
jgi:anti-anti-sigma factor